MADPYDRRNMQQAQRGGPGTGPALERVMSELQVRPDAALLAPRERANRLIRVPHPGALAAGVTSNPQTLQFYRAGWVLDMYGQVKEVPLDSALADVQVRVQLSGDRDLATDGLGGAFVPLAALFGAARHWFPIAIPVRSGDVWTVTFRNTSATDVRTPDVLFSFSEEGGGGR